MNTRIIKSILTKKHEDFVASIKDKAIQEMVNKNSIITGGSIVSMLFKEKVNDFDYYLTDFETAKAVTAYYVDEFNRLHGDKPNDKTAEPQMHIKDSRIKIRTQSGGIAEENTNENQYQFEEGEEYVRETIADTLGEANALDEEKIEDEKKEKYRPIFLTDNAITLSNKIQIVIRFYGDAEEIHSNYDFIHCTCCWTSKDGKLVLPPAALESMLTKQLYYSGSKYPVCSFIRCRKFLKKGWHINAGQMLKICLQISKLDLMNLEVLEDQLTGVDTAYFVQVLDYLRDRQAKDENFHLEMPYLASIIDKMFQ